MRAFSSRDAVHVNVGQSAREHILGRDAGRTLCGILLRPDEITAPTGLAMCATCRRVLSGCGRLAG
jgi:hypothetical protein